MAGIYIHIPFCRSKCRYCDFVSYPAKLGFADAYMACVLKEMQFRAKDLQGKSFDTVYFGGGTPSVIDAKWITGCMNQIRACFRLSEKAEVTIELNPGTVDAARVEAYKKAGVNRFSVGLQSANDALLEEIGRIHDAQWSRGAKFGEGSIASRLRAWSTVLVPLFVGMFRRADDLAVAMDARCYGMPGVQRTSLTRKPLAARDVAKLLVGLVGCVALAVMG